MAFLRLGEYVQITDLKEWRLPSEFFIWTGIVTSLCFAVGMLLVQKIFNYIARAERQRRISERRILNTVLRTEEKRTAAFFERSARRIGAVAFVRKDVYFGAFVRRYG